MRVSSYLHSALLTGEARCASKHFPSSRAVNFCRERQRYHAAGGDTENYDTGQRRGRQTADLDELVDGVQARLLQSWGASERRKDERRVIWKVKNRYRQRYVRRTAVDTVYCFCGRRGRKGRRGEIANVAQNNWTESRARRGKGSETFYSLAPSEASSSDKMVAQSRQRSPVSSDMICPSLLTTSRPKRSVSLWPWAEGEASCKRAAAINCNFRQCPLLMPSFWGRGVRREGLAKETQGKVMFVINEIDERLCALCVGGCNRGRHRVCLMKGECEAYACQRDDA